MALVFPGMDPDRRGAEIDPAVDLTTKLVPMGLLSVGAALRAAGAEVRAFDARFAGKAEAREAVRSLAAWADGVGFSVTVSQIPQALALSEEVRRSSPARTVWFGTHPSLFPAQTVADPAVDVVVQGEGEVAFAALASAWAAGRSPDGVSDLAVKAPDGSVRVNPRAPLPPLETLPPPAYDLLPLERYLVRRHLDGRVARGLDVLASRGCPFRCGFCVTPAVDTRQWRSLPPPVLVDRVERLVRAHDLAYVWFIDDYFFGNKRWIAETVDELLRRPWRVRWEANVRTSDFRDAFLDDAFLARLAESGCYALRMGMESGSDRILSLIDKDATVADTRRAVTACRRHGIISVGTWLMGVPGETSEDLERTLRLIWEVHQVNPDDPHWAPGVYRPYPTGPLYRKALAAGFREPATLREWAEVARVGAVCERHGGAVRACALPWLTDPGLLDDIVTYGEMVMPDRLAGHRLRLLRRPFDAAARWRFRSGLWRWRWDAAAYRALRRLYEQVSE